MLDTGFWLLAPAFIMPYSDIEDQKNETPLETIRQLVCDEGESADSLSYLVVIARFNQIRDEADGEMDGFFSIGGYPVPLATVGTLVRGWSKAITGYKLFKRRDIMPEARQKEFDRIQRLLEKISQGSFKLPTTEQANTASETGLGMAVITNTRFSDT